MMDSIVVIYSVVRYYSEGIKVLLRNIYLQNLVNSTILNCAYLLALLL